MGDVVVFPYRAAAYLTEEERERLRSRRMLRASVEAAAREFEVSLARSRSRPGAWESIVVQRLHDAVEYGLCSGDWEGAERLIDVADQPHCAWRLPSRKEVE